MFIHNYLKKKPISYKTDLHIQFCQLYFLSGKFTDVCGPSNITCPAGSVMNLTSPFYPWIYDVITTCEYNFNIPDGTNVLVEFVDLDIGGFFSNDELYLDDERFTKRTQLPEFYTSAGNTLRIRYTLDHIFMGGKFLLTLHCINASGKEPNQKIDGLI